MPIDSCAQLKLNSTLKRNQLALENASRTSAVLLDHTLECDADAFTGQTLTLAHHHKKWLTHGTTWFVPTNKTGLAGTSLPRNAPRVRITRSRVTHVNKPPLRHTFFEARILCRKTSGRSF
jgi:hypothetical protein